MSSELRVAEVPLGIAFVDADEHFSWVNDRAAELLDARADTLRGQRLGDLLSLAPQDLFSDADSRPLMMTLTSDPRRAVMVERTSFGDGEIIGLFDATDRYAALLELRSSHSLADRTRERLQLIIDASIAFTAATSERSLAEILAETTARAYRAEESAVFLLNHSGWLELIAGSNPLAAFLAASAPADWVRNFRDPFLASGATEAAAFSPALAAAMAEHDIHAVLLAPIYYEGSSYGVLACFFMHPRTFDSEAAPLARALGGQAAQVLATLRLQERLAHAATHDEITGLPNRRLLELQVAQLSQPSVSRLAALFLDLDRFKAINDTFGHAIGDEVLRVVASRLRVHLRDGDLVARYGGDEFLVVCLVEDLAAASEIADRLRTSVQAPIDAPGGTLSVSVSIGIALTEPDAAVTDVDQLVRAADQAMYRAKGEGGNRVVAT